MQTVESLAQTLSVILEELLERTLLLFNLSGTMEGGRVQFPLSGLAPVLHLPKTCQAEEECF